MSTAANGAKQLSVLPRYADTAQFTSRCSAASKPLWEFYACGLVDENDEFSNEEDTEDELETQDWIQFQRQRTYARLATTSQIEARIARSAQH
ncbi:hypothetical protein CCR75_008616 [Bremia lactucae]|uniref:Uncharacterized protein n=1 Tax=Bremia lactucae TaxID=4779 RepID=A0A976NZA9_BRELC|nr:hypothetical protein CCR75_008616 [Bremia lactucae]